MTVLKVVRRHLIRLITNLEIDDASRLVIDGEEEQVLERNVLFDPSNGPASQRYIADGQLEDDALEETATRHV